MKIIMSLALCLFIGTSTGCSKSSEALLKEQSDLICACETSECAFDVLKGPINQELKTRKGEISEEGRKEKQRMMGCILKLKSDGK